MQGGNGCRLFQRQQSHDHLAPSGPRIGEGYPASEPAEFFVPLNSVDLE